MVVDELTAEFRAHLSTGGLHIQRCSNCELWRHIPRVMCSACGSIDWTWQVVTGRGRLFSWTTTERAMHPDFRDVPYTIAVVELDEGPRLVARLTVPAGESPRADAEVRLVPPNGEADALVPEFLLHTQNLER